MRIDGRRRRGFIAFEAEADPAKTAPCFEQQPGPILAWFGDGKEQPPR